jgi:hypothetical protein
MTLQPHQIKAMKAHVDSGRPLAEFVPPQPVAKKPRKNEESVMQRALVKWWAANCRHFGVPELCLFSIPNGGNGSAKRGSIMKAEGQRRGAPDLMLAVVGKPAGESKDVYATLGFQVARHHGLFLELKTPTGHLSPEQEVYHEILRNQGYKVVVCRSLFECINQITNYLK